MKKPTPCAPIIHLPSARERIAVSVRDRVRAAIRLVIDEELEEALGVRPYGRPEERRGYRNGSLDRLVTSEYGPAQLRVPRARLMRDDGTTTEWHSHVVPRYERRTSAVNAALLGVYLVRNPAIMITWSGGS